MVIRFKQASRLLLLALLTMSLVACGFHLRGLVELPTQLKILTINSQSGSDNFDRALRIALNKAGATVVEKVNATENTLELKINPITLSDTELATNSSNDTSQVHRVLKGHYFVRQNDGKSVYGPRSISTSKTLTNQDGEESAKLSYNTAQTEEMYEVLATQLVSDLSYAPL
ncbi:rare lipoprotein B [Marinomonas ushuaiensis DSM 15871]|uniref:LPS-assembly lipoprotein LptE n=1 Tax=Marinomonas ushuaiensis DSM 15871 TaxID=1122207 RepID=X7E4S6_9GAMM|nr:LPS assembly lipoprotein LptE [Marinomonas ushuaiensis]ETX11064.1 rare lipoprotein B [Marinomonas ushuaiensis DSM 15871]